MKTGVGSFIVVAGLLAGSVMPSDARQSGFLRYIPADTWTCAKILQLPERVMWVSKRGGVALFFKSGGRMEFFDLSCVPEATGVGGCEYKEEGWGSVSVDVRGPSPAQTISFDQNTPEVDTEYKHHATVTGVFAGKITAAFRSGASANIAIKRKDGSTLYTQHVELAGFGPALDKCIAHWGEKPN